MAKSWVVEHFKLTEYQRKKWSQGMLYVECYSVVIIRTVISFKYSEYEVWVRSLP